MDASELERIQERVDTLKHARAWEQPNMGPAALHWLIGETDTLLAIIERLQAVEAAAREVDVHHQKIHAQECAAPLKEALDKLHDALKGAEDATQTE